LGLNADDVEQILALLERSSFDELSLEYEGMKLVLRRGASASLPPARDPAPVAAPAAPAAPTPAAPPAKAAAAAAPAVDGAVDVPAPLLGVFFRAPKPGEPPFVEVGQRVEPDTVIGIIEVMKLMNSVRAGVAGEIVAIAAENGALVEYGQTLVRVREG
jgi:acetyl-CoA carboxylase biotin carboxyl carrier protein